MKSLHIQNLTAGNHRNLRGRSLHAFNDESSWTVENDVSQCNTPYPFPPQAALTAWEIKILSFPQQ